MKTHAITLIALAAGASAWAQPMQYPETRKDDTKDIYHGTTIADPYRWLEDDRSPETAEWVKKENEVTNSFLSQIPYRGQILSRLEELSTYERYGLPQKAGKYYFYYKNDGLQNQSVLYRQEGMQGAPEVFLDPNKLSAEGTTVANLLDFSQDDKYAAFAVQKAGSDWQEIVVYDVASAKPVGDTLKWVKFSGAAWHGNGFYYSRYDAPKGSALSQKNENQKVYFHTMNEPQSADKLVYEDPKNPLRYYGAQVTEGKRYMALTVGQGTSGDEIYVKDLQNPAAKLVKICPGFKDDYAVIDNVGEQVLVYTNADAPTYRLVSIDPKNPAKANWKNILPAGNDLLQGVALIGNKLVASYLHDVTSRMRIFDLNGKLEREVALPGLGTLAGIEGERNLNDAYFGYTSFNYPTSIIKLNLTTGETSIFRKPNFPAKLDDIEVKQEFYTSKDGAKVPMFIIHKKGLAMDGTRPTLLYAYGGFNISLTPGFQASMLPLLERGGVYVMANLRGGGEYGEKWHKAGMLEKKQTVFNDFIAAAEHLIAKKYTDAAHLAIQGGSNGGLLVGAVMVQRPDLFKVAFPAVGVLDMLRYHKFTVGWGWAVEYGSSDTARHFANLIKYSPLHNIKPGTAYPATLVTTADHDDRVVPAHSFKFIAALQAAQKGDNPVLIRIETNAGHGAGKPLKKQLEERADILAFMLWNMGIKS